MGYTFNELVAPAVLFLNPGVTREELIKLLDKTHSANIHEYSSEEPWNFWTEQTQDNKYHEGLNGLAQLLGLKQTQEYHNFQISKLDSNNLLIRPPYVFPAREKDSHKLEVIVHQENVFEEPIEIESCSWEKLKPGDIWEEPQIGMEKGIVLDVLEETEYEKREEEFDDSGPGFNYRLKIRPFYWCGRVEKFNSEQEMHQSWPQFHPDFIYDWNQEKGHLFVGSFFGSKEFLWMQRDKKYYLDPETFDKIPASFRCSDSHHLGYTDLVLTAEAVKHNAWKVLSYKGLEHFYDFLKDFPDARLVYERAVWDSHTSLSAKLQGLTVSEFLRFRMLRD